MKADVDKLRTITEKLNHLAIEYRSLNGGSATEGEKRNNLDDIYGSLFGRLIVTYDKATDDYNFQWKQRSDNGTLVKFGLGGDPSLYELSR